MRKTFSNSSPFARTKSGGGRGGRGMIEQPTNRGGVRINEDIKAPTVRVVDAEGVMLGIMPIREARERASEQSLDLVEIAPQAAPPVVKIIDFGKFQYEQHKRDKLQKKQQHQSQLKEVRFKAGTDTHDFDFKTRHARTFLLEGDKVKATVMFRGREIQHMEFGAAILKRFIEQLDDVGKVDQQLRTEGRSMTVTMAPDKDKQKRLPQEKHLNPTTQETVSEKALLDIGDDEPIDSADESTIPSDSQE